MNQPNPEPPAGRTIAGVHVEDVILYLFSLALLAVIAFALLRSEGLIAGKLVLQAPPRSETSDIAHSYLNAQVDLSVRRYQQANGALLARTARINGAFLLGASMLLLGCLLVVRRVRESPLTSKMEAGRRASFELVTSSPGSYMAFLGTIIIVVCLLTVGTNAATDSGISFPPMGATTDMVGTGSVDASDIGTTINKIPVR